MNKTVATLVCMSLLSAPALAQVRPENCVPVFPLQDPAMASVPQDVIADPIAPAEATRRSFFGLPFLPLLAGIGGLGVLAATGDGNDDPDEIVSPA